MMNTSHLLVAILVLISAPLHAKDTVVLHGTVFDRNGRPRKSCVVEAKAPGFEAVAKTSCDAKGHYSLVVPKGLYNAIYICDDNYKKSTLEFWAWNIDLTEDFELNATFDTLEVYNLSVFNSKGGPASMFLAFRPMSLEHYQKPSTQRFAPPGGQLGVLYDISPAIDIESITVTIDDKPAEKEHLTWYHEKVAKPGDQQPTYLPACLLQIKRPSLSAGVHNVRVTIKDKKTGAMGQALTQFVSNSAGFGF